MNEPLLDQLQEEAEILDAPIDSLDHEDIVSHVLSPIESADVAKKFRNTYQQSVDKFRFEIRNEILLTRIREEKAILRIFNKLIEKCAYKEIDDSLVAPIRDYAQEIYTQGLTSISSEDFPEEVKESIDALSALLAQDFDSKLEANIYYKRLEEYVPKANTANDMLAITKAYIFIRTISTSLKEIKPDKSYSYFLKKMLSRAGEINADPFDLQADPEAIADLLEPSIEEFINDEEMKELYSGSDERLYGTGPFISSQLIARTQGTAEGVATIRLRERMAKKGYEGFRRTKSSKEHEHRIGERYISEVYLRKINENIYGKGSEVLSDNIRALDESTSIMVKAILELSQDDDYPIAKQIAGAIEKLKTKNSLGNRSVLSFTSFIKLANILRDQINIKRAFSSDEYEPLERLDENSLIDFPASFQRILYAIEPQLLSKALTDDIYTEDKPFLRSRMALLEALSMQWEDSQRRYAMELGDVVMRLSAQGLDDEQISAVITELKAKDQIDSRMGIGHVAVQSLKPYTLDPRTNNKRVVSRKRAPGYGAIS